MSEFFISLKLFVEESFYNKMLNFLENFDTFLSVDYKKSINTDYWILNIIFESTFNKCNFLQQINSLRIDCSLPVFVIDQKNYNTTFPYITFDTIKNQDWLKKNKEILKPIVIDDFYIYDDDHHKFEHYPLISLKIKASYAFGSGYHETTKNCIKAICYILKRNKVNSFLDYGTGSGILGICHKKKIPMGNTIFLDNDNQSINLTKFNLKKNSLNSLGNTYLNPKNKNKYMKKRYYNVVVANILLKPLKILIKEFNYILKNKSFLIISGILKHQARSLVNKYRKFNFVVYKSYKENNWITIIFKRR